MRRRQFSARLDACLRAVPRFSRADRLAGFFRIVRGTNECGIEDQVTGSPSGAKWTKASEEF